MPSRSYRWMSYIAEKLQHDLLMSEQLLPVFGRRDLILLFEKPVEMAGVGITHGIDDLLDGYLGIFQQFTGFGQLDTLDKVCEISAGIFL